MKSSSQHDAVNPEQAKQRKKAKDNLFYRQSLTNKIGKFISESYSRFWSSISIKVEIDPKTNRPYATITPSDPNSVAYVYEQMYNKIALGRDSPVKGKVTFSYGSSEFHISVVDGKTTMAELEAALDSFRFDKRKSSAEDSAIENKASTTEESTPTNNSPQRKKRKIGCEESTDKKQPWQTALNQLIAVNVNETPSKTQEQIDEEEFWKSVIIGVTVDVCTQRPCAVVTVVPADITKLHLVYQRMTWEILNRPNSPLRGKVSCSFENQDEFFAEHKNYFFFIESKDYNITKDEFEAAVNDLKIHKSEQNSNVNLPLNEKAEQSNPEFCNSDEYDSSSIYSLFNHSNQTEVRDLDPIVDALDQDEFRPV